MKAAHLTACKNFEIINSPTPHPDPKVKGSVLVKTAYSAVCGSDLPRFSLSSEPFPKRPGQPMHECIGTVVESHSDQFRAGDRVLALPEANSGLAEYFLSSESRTIALDNSTPWQAEHVLAQPLGTVLCALKRLDNVLDKTVVVLGQGPIGLMFTQMLGLMGAKCIIAIEPVSHRLTVAGECFATHLINPETDNTLEAVAEITHGNMADIVIEAVGHQSQTINDAIALTRHKGTLVAFGVPDEPHYVLNFNELFRRNISLLGSVGPNPGKDFTLALDLITQKRFNTAGLMSHQMHFTRAQEAFELAISKQDRVIKIILEYES
jgi:L-iditol 2-dehydrogenase